MDIEVIALGSIAVAAVAGAIKLYMPSGKPVIEERRVQVPRYIQYTPAEGEHVHKAGEFSAASNGWYCTEPLEDGTLCGLHKHVYYDNGVCACGQAGKPGTKEWEAE
jgi:hypothetical protein